MSEEIRRLEEKIAYLEHHVTEQDKVMLEMGDQLRRLKREVERLGGRIASVSEGATDSPGNEAAERPPHY